MARLRRVIETGDVISLLSFDRNMKFFLLCSPLAIRIFLLSLIIGINFNFLSMLKTFMILFKKSLLLEIYISLTFNLMTLFFNMMLHVILYCLNFHFYLFSNLIFQSFNLFSSNSFDFKTPYPIFRQIFMCLFTCMYLPPSDYTVSFLVESRILIIISLTFFCSSLELFYLELFYLCILSIL